MVKGEEKSEKVIVENRRVLTIYQELGNISRQEGARRNEKDCSSEIWGVSAASIQRDLKRSFFGSRQRSTKACLGRLIHTQYLS